MGFYEEVYGKGNIEWEIEDYIYYIRKKSFAVGVVEKRVSGQHFLKY